MSKLQLRFNDGSLNTEIKGPFSLSTGSPISLEHEVYIGNGGGREYIQL